MSRGSWQDSPVKLERLTVWIHAGLALSRALITGFESRYGEDRCVAGDFPEGEEKFFSTANVLSHTLLAAQHFVGIRYTDGDDVPYDPFLDWALGSAKGCFDDWSKLDWVNVEWKGNDMTMQIDHIDQKDRMAN